MNKEQNTGTSLQIDRRKFQFRVKREAPNTCFSAYVADKFIGKQLPTSCDRFRVGVGGTYLTVVPHNEDEPITLHNIEHGESFDLAIIAIVDTDCSNIVVMN